MLSIEDGSRGSHIKNARGRRSVCHARRSLCLLDARTPASDASQAHPTVDIKVLPGVSSVTAFALILEVSIDTGAELTLRKTTDGKALIGSNRFILFKMTDAPTTYEKTGTGYEVTFGQQPLIDTEEMTVTIDPSKVTGRDYCTPAYA